MELSWARPLFTALDDTPFSGTPLYSYIKFIQWRFFSWWGKQSKPNMVEKLTPLTSHCNEDRFTYLSTSLRSLFTACSCLVHTCVPCQQELIALHFCFGTQNWIKLSRWRVSANSKVVENIFLICLRGATLTCKERGEATRSIPLRWIRHWLYLMSKMVAQYKSQDRLELLSSYTVSYTHLTLPTILRV